MAVVHNTTMVPTKLELLAEWLPKQDWYIGAADAPKLDRAGGFRLDDPEGEVGIEFMVVTDDSGDEPVSYHVPLTYRGAPLEGVEAHALIGNSEHGVLGTRWIYCGTHDPVLQAQLLALLQGLTEAQAQRLSDTPDPSVGVRVLKDEDMDSQSIELLRVVTSSRADDAAEPRDCVTVDWRLPDGTVCRGALVALRD